MKLRTPMRSPDQKVEVMRKDIGIELVRDARNQITAFNVSYSSRDPRVAQKVTSELTNLFINEKSGSAAAAVRRHHQISREPIGDAPGKLCRTRKRRFVSSRASM